MLLQGYCVCICKEIVDLVSLKTRKVHLHSYEPFNWDHRSTAMQLSCECLLSVVFFLFIFIVTYFFQRNKEVLYEMISLEGATSLFSKEVVLDQRTGMIGTATAAHDLQVEVLLHSMKSAVSYFVGDKKYLST